MPIFRQDIGSNRSAAFLASELCMLKLLCRSKPHRLQFPSRLCHGFFFLNLSQSQRDSPSAACINQNIVVPAQMQ